MGPDRRNNAGIEIGDLAALDLQSLREHWRTLYECEPPVRMSRELLIQSIAYRLQEQRYGGLSRQMRLKLAEAGKLGTGGKNRDKSKASVRRKIKPGTRFLREWKGRTHEVTATADGRFVYRGTSYRSLSAIAREITGTRWSGPAFFGLFAKTKADGQTRQR
ncbi:DUF2924 domain-containing protein [Microbaculum marinisediminis]|uniref:DUF2924 domain-containing protein n=1 Tax=Microbaculum marinisediminis TaxID=2931392 RepID=A0AAW5QWR3_9HYPH|nr:DUF2924 domain-containing protein [Microbaculum sp. A6E488]MCT8971442.1 DUF2924 domain-containing protein [Microbaculum sp. A6E488]